MSSKRKLDELYTDVSSPKKEKKKRRKDNAPCGYRHLWMFLGKMRKPFWSINRNVGKLPHNYTVALSSSSIMSMSFCDSETGFANLTRTFPI
jgi:hypothetical protein